MNPEIKSRWVSKLREKGRKQTRSMLRDVNGGQCCLDVLNEVAIEDEVIEAPVLYIEDGCYVYSNTTSYGDPYLESDVLPRAVREWAGLDSIDPEIADSNGIGSPASHWNDYQYKTFPQIADMIEADESL
jgi:hypothetical protein